MAIRIELNKKIYGVMVVSIPNGLGIDEEELGLFEEVREHLAHAFYSLEVEEVCKRAEEALRKLAPSKDQTPIVLTNVNNKLKYSKFANLKL